MNKQLALLGGKTPKQFFKLLYRCRMLYVMILPGLITVFIFHYIPLYGVQIAFRDFSTKRGFWGSEWVGLKHFVKFIQYPYFKEIVWNTLWINLASLLIFPIPVIFSLMLNEMGNQKLKKVCQMVTYAPYFVSTVVVCSMVKLFTNKEGLINIILGFFGREAVDFMSQPGAFVPIYVLSGLWSGLGWGTVIYMATLSGVSPELIEAARIDGAKRMQIIWHVNLPHLKPTIITLFVLRMGSMLSVGFEKVFLLQNALNKDVSNVISTYVYQVGLLNMDYSYSSAVGLFNSVINIIMIVTANTIAKRMASTSLW